MRLLPVLLALFLVVPAAASGQARVSIGADGAQADGPSGAEASRAAAVSADGRTIAFTSAATNLVPGDANGRSDVFLRDRVRGRTIRVSGAGGGFEPSLSGSGERVLYSVITRPGRRTLRLFDRRTGRTVTLRVRRRGVAARDLRIISATLGPDGRHAAVVAGARDIGQDVRDVALTVLDTRTGRERTVVSRPYNDLAGVSLSWGARWIAFSTGARLLRGDRNGVSDVYAIRVKTGRRLRVSRSTGGRGARRFSYDPQVSASGTHVAFVSAADNLVAGDTNRAHDVFVHALRRRTTRRVSVDARERQLRGYSTSPSISRYGTRIAFQRSPDSVIADGEGPIGDVLVRDARNGTTQVLAAGRSGFPAIAATDRLVAFASARSDLVPGDTNGVTDVFAARF